MFSYTATMDQNLFLFGCSDNLASSLLYKINKCIYLINSMAVFFISHTITKPISQQNITKVELVSSFFKGVLV